MRRTFPFLLVVSLVIPMARSSAQQAGPPKGTWAAEGGRAGYFQAPAAVEGSRD